MTDMITREHGLEYNTERDKVRLKAYGRDIQQMVDHCMQLPTKSQRQRAAEAIIDAMKRVVPSQQSFKERTPMLWYHLALMSDFQLDIDYPVEFPKEDKMATPPDKIPYTKNRIRARHYGYMLFSVFERLKVMPEGPLRRQLAVRTAMQMQRCLMTWGAGSTNRERVVSDLAKYTDGIVQLQPSDFKSQVPVEPVVATAEQPKKKKKKKK